MKFGGNSGGDKGDIGKRSVGVDVIKTHHMHVGTSQTTKQFL